MKFVQIKVDHSLKGKEMILKIGEYFEVHSKFYFTNEVLKFVVFVFVFVFA
jgi:hypothetical protein